MGLKKVQKQGRDENARKLSCWRKVMVKKDWKTTLLLFSSFPCFCTFFRPIPTCTSFSRKMILPLVYTQSHAYFHTSPQGGIFEGAEELPRLLQFTIRIIIPVHIMHSEMSVIIQGSIPLVTI